MHLLWINHIFCNRIVLSVIYTSLCSRLKLKKIDPRRFLSLNRTAAVHLVAKSIVLARRQASDVTAAPAPRGGRNAASRDPGTVGRGQGWRRRRRRRWRRVRTPIQVTSFRRGPPGCRATGNVDTTATGALLSVSFIPEEMRCCQKNSEKGHP